MANFVNPNFDTNLSSWIAGIKPNQVAGNKLSAWWDFSQLTGYSDGAEITLMTDFSPNGNTMTPAGGTGPAFKVNQINGLNVARYADGQLLHRGGIINANQGNDDFSHFIVFKPSAQNDGDTIVTYGINGVPQSMLMIYRSGSNKWWWDYFGGGDVASFGTLSNGTPYLMTGLRESGVSKPYLNGLAGPTETVGVNVWWYTYLGNLPGYVLYASGDVGEYFILKGQTATELADLHSYLGLKWGLPITNRGAAFTRDTGIKYAGAASMKVVAVNDVVVGEEIDAGATYAFQLTGFAYTTGAAVTSADVELYYNGATVTTNYISMGGGWYKLSASVPGIMGATRTGVKVKAGKTVYLDSFDLAGVSVGPFPTFLP